MKNRLTLPSLIRAGFAGLMLLTLVVTPRLHAQDNDPVPDKVADILKNMAALIEESDEFAFKAEILFDEILSNGQSIQHEAEIAAAVERPNHLAARFEGDEATRSLWIAGEELTASNETRGVYSKAKVPAGVKPALDHLMEKYDVSMPLADFVIDGIYESLLSNVENAVYAGKSEVGEHDCHHISCSQEFIDWQLWVDDGLLPLPRKILITYKSVPGIPRYSAIFTKWSLDAELPESTFEPKIPSDAIKIDLLEIKREAE